MLLSSDNESGGGSVRLVSSDDEMSSDNESGGGSVRLASSDDETWGKHSLLGVFRDGTLKSKERSEQQASGSGASASGESSPNEWMIGRDKAEAAGGHLGSNGKQVSPD